MTKTIPKPSYRKYQTNALGNEDSCKMNNTNVSLGGVLPRNWAGTYLFKPVICDVDVYYDTAYVRQVTSEKILFGTCPQTITFDIKFACPSRGLIWKNTIPRLKWKGNHICAFFYWVNRLYHDILYDIKLIWINLRHGDFHRYHTCGKAHRLTNIRVEAYGEGWAFLTWDQPKDNCRSYYHYDLSYSVQNYYKELYRIGEYQNEDNWYTHHKVIACPQYPQKYCVMLNNNINPFDVLQIQVRFVRFDPQEEFTDMSDWAYVNVTTDDLGRKFGHCPPPASIFVTLWFAIALGVLFLFLLGVAICMARSLRNRKREMELGSKYYQAEKNIPASSALGRAMQRLQNFFKELCPTPQKPPPPPPAPKRKSKPKKKTTGKSKPKKKTTVKAKPKKKTTEKSKPKKKKPQAKQTQGKRSKLRAIAPPKSTTRTRSPKDIRDMKQKNIKGPERTGLLDTAKAQSNVGGGSSSRRPRR